MKKIIDFITTILLIFVMIEVGKYFYEQLNIEKNSGTKIFDELEVDAGISEKKYYYEQLDEVGKIIYNYIEANKENMKQGDYVIEIKNAKVNETLNEEGGDNIVTEAFNSAWVAYSYDNPDLFYIDVNKVNLIVEYRKNLLKTDYTVKMQSSENDTYLQKLEGSSSIESAIRQVEDKKKNILANISGSQYNKTKQIHDWLVKNVEYTQNETINQYDLYGALVRGQAVCEGYAEAFKYLLDGAGIENVIVSGIAINSNGDKDLHAWNYVKLNEEWYGVDVAWDDPVVVGGGSLSEEDSHKYFLRSRGYFEKSHFSDGKVAEKGMTFKYPTLSINDYK